jgi:hypothetical protein
MQLCAACGAPSAAVAAVAPPAATPPKSGGSALKIVLIIVAVFVGLGVLSAGAFGFFVWRVAHSFRVSGSDNNVAVNIPGGNFSANTAESFSSSELGTDVYPGSQSGKGGMRMSLPTGSMVSAVYVTSDSKDQVVAFYKGRFGSNAASFDTGNSAVLTVKKSDQESVVVTITTNPSEYQGKTQIHIVHTTASKSS